MLNMSADHYLSKIIVDDVLVGSGYNSYEAKTVTGGANMEKGLHEVSFWVMCGHSEGLMRGIRAQHALNGRFDMTVKRPEDQAPVPIMKAFILEEKSPSKK